MKDGIDLDFLLCCRKRNLKRLARFLGLSEEGASPELAERIARVTAEPKRLPEMYG
jgi:hypothetical protein